MPTLSPQQKEQLALHWSLVKAAQAQFNLTAILEDDQARSKHYLDCLALLPLINTSPAPRRLLDIGSGGGFPGLVIAVACPQLSVTLLEATQKKCAFLSSCGQQLGLSNLRVINARAEEAGRDPELRGSFDLVSARAVAGLNVLLELALPLLTMGGRLLAMKGEAWQEELAQAAPALTLLGGAARPTYEYSLPGGDRRAIVDIEKQSPTPDKYPRRPGMPNKRPL